MTKQCTNTIWPLIPVRWVVLAKIAPGNSSTAVPSMIFLAEFELAFKDTSEYLKLKTVLFNTGLDLLSIIVSILPKIPSHV